MNQAARSSSTSPAASLGALTEALERAEGLARPVIVSVRAPLGSVSKILPEDEPELALFVPPTGLARAAWGSVLAVGGAGPERLHRASIEARAVLAGLTKVGDEDAPAPVMLGGFGFDMDSAGGPWSPLGATRFLLPRFAYVVEDGCAWMQVILTDENARAESTQAIAAVEAAFARLDGPEVSRPRGTTAIDGAPPEQWTQAVTTAQAAMARGELDKVVLSRRIRLSAREPWSTRALAAALDDAEGAVTRFLIASGGAVFLGATPERLAEVRGLRVRTQALAGSTGRGPGGVERLLADHKEREEHAHVVAHLRQRLEGVCRELDVGASPRLERLGYVTHLCTEVEGTLDAPRTVLEIAARLHPTPAVGGVPLEAAQAVIRAAEPEPRGWYAGGVGWMDAAGDGEMKVALRCALWSQGEGVAFVGAGIVRGSDPDREWSETQIKAQAVLSILGIG